MGRRYFSRKPIVLFAVACALAVLFYFFPLFKVTSLRIARQQSADGLFNPAAFVEQFWEQRLLPTEGRAVDAADLVIDVALDRKAARQKHGRGMGLGDVYYFYVAGTGHVVAVNTNSVAVALREGQSHPDVILETGNIFGNTVRDGTGLLNVSDFPNSKDFNDISAEINRRIEQQVLPKLRAKAAVGSKLRFVGCAEIVDEDADLRPLRVIPFVVESP